MPIPSRFLRWCGALALACLATAPVLVWAQSSVVTFASFGGRTQDAEVNDLLADAGKLGLTVRQERSGFWVGIKAHLVANAPGWDMTSIGFARCEQAARGGYLLPVDYSVVDRKQVPDGMALPDYLGVYTFSYGIAYQTGKYGADGPKNWADFWDVKRFPGRRSLLAEGLYSLEAALLADGVAPGDVYAVLKTPKGLDRAFAKLDEIRPYVSVWYRSSGQALQMMRDGEVDMALLANGRAAELVQAGTPISFVWNQAFMDVNCFMVPKNAPDPHGAMQVLAGALDPANQARFAQASGYGPTNPRAFDAGILKPEEITWLPTAPQNIHQQIVADQSWYASPEAEAAYVRFAKLLQ